MHGSEDLGEAVLTRGGPERGGEECGGGRGGGRAEVAV